MQLLTLHVGSTPIEAPPGIVTGGFANGAFQRIIHLGIQLLFFAAVLLAILFLLWAGLKWIMAAGDKQKLQTAQAQITYAIIGLILVFSVFFLVSFIGSVFGVHFFAS